MDWFGLVCVEKSKTGRFALYDFLSRLNNLLLPQNQFIIWKSLDQCLHLKSNLSHHFIAIVNINIQCGLNQANRDRLTIGEKAETQIRRNIYKDMVQILDSKLSEEIKWCLRMIVRCKFEMGLNIPHCSGFQTFFSRGPVCGPSNEKKVFSGSTSIEPNVKNSRLRDQ